MDQYSFEVIGYKRDNPNMSVRKEDGFPIENIELLIGKWTCRGPLTGENLAKYLARKFYKERYGEIKIREYESDTGQAQVYWTEFFLEPVEIEDVIGFLNSERCAASQTDKRTGEEFASEVLPIFESALSWLQSLDDSYWIHVRLVEKYVDKEIKRSGAGRGQAAALYQSWLENREERKEYRARNAAMSAGWSTVYESARKTALKAIGIDDEDLSGATTEQIKDYRALLESEMDTEWMKLEAKLWDGDFSARK